MDMGLFVFSEMDMEMDMESIWNCSTFLLGQVFSTFRNASWDVSTFLYFQQFVRFAVFHFLDCDTLLGHFLSFLLFGFGFAKLPLNTGSLLRFHNNCVHLYLYIYMYNEN